jgi:polysaccharide biosynthesis protein PslH
MRIAFLTSRIPYPLITGDRVRAFNILKHLARGHEVTVYSIGSSDSAADLMSRLPVKVRTVEIGYLRAALNLCRAAIRGTPFQAELYFNPELSRALGKELEVESTDLVYVHLIRMAEYARQLSGVPRFMDACDCFYLNYKNTPLIWHMPLSWAGRLERESVAKYEAAMPGWFERIFAVSELDAAAIKANSGRNNVTVLPMGIDVDPFSGHSRKIESGRIIFSGKLDYAPNYDAAIFFAKSIFPGVKTLLPHAKFVIAGMNPNASLRSLQRMEGISVLANVPDLKAEIAKSTVSVAPMRFGTGMQIKVLEALALGTPVVCTPKVALPITGGRSGAGVAEATTPEEFVSQLVRILRDSRLRQSIADDARRWALNNLGWNKLLRPLDDALAEIEVRRRPKCLSYIVSR